MVSVTLTVGAVFILGFILEWVHRFFYKPIEALEKRTEEKVNMMLHDRILSENQQHHGFNPEKAKILIKELKLIIQPINAVGISRQNFKNMFFLSIVIAILALLSENLPLPDYITGLILITALVAALYFLSYLFVINNYWDLVKDFEKKEDYTNWIKFRETKEYDFID